MTTSDSDPGRGGRCTRISPSAILDDRLTGKDLDWARDHLRRCDPCRVRIEDFQEMRLRIDRLPQAPVGAAAVEDAFLIVVPNAPRPVPSQARVLRTAETGAEPKAPPARHEFLTSPAPKVASVPDLFGELEREFFRDTPQAEPAPTAEPAPLDAQTVDGAPSAEPEAVLAQPPAEPIAEHVPEPPAEIALREVPVDSGHPVHDATPIVGYPEVADEDAGSLKATPWIDHDVVPVDGKRGRADGAMRLAVGLGAAGCVLLAALLYESGLFPTGKQTGATVAARPSASATVSTQRVTSSPTIQPSATPTTAATPPPPPVLATLGDGVTGESVFRIRPGTAVAGFTRLVFDLTGTGLPTMLIAQPDALHLQVTFRGTGGAGLPVGGIHSTQVAGIEPAVVQGSDLMVTIDLARPIRLTDFTLPPAQGYAPRLVLDLHTT
jgi:hypothetical protein